MCAYTPPRWLLFFFLALFPLQAADYRVLYTGRLYGYFRYPEIQSEAISACPVDEQAGGAMPAIDTELLNQFRAPDSTITVRVAVGDNFAPFILARLIRKADSLKGKEDAEDVHLPVDNVACFMQLLHLDAVVPGEHDFYFGPERLRVLSRVLRQPAGALSRTDADPIPYTPVRMLGANLSLRTRAVDPKQPYTSIDQNARALGREPRSPNDPVPDLPPVVLPWMRTVNVRNAFTLRVDGHELQSEMARARLKTAAFTKTEAERFNDLVEHDAAKIGPMTGADGHQYEFTRNFQEICIVRSPSPTAADSSADRAHLGCQAPEYKLNPIVRANSEEFRLSIDVSYALEPGRLLAADQNYALVLTRAGARASWQGFQVQPAYFESPITAAEKKQQPPGAIKPWVCVGTPGAQQVAVFGVVDSGMAEFIGRLNYTWRDTDNNVYDPHHETDLQVSDPAESLQQVLDYFAEASECKDARKVLLAQMHQNKVPDIIARLHQPFDMVIAQSDRDLASGDKNLDEHFDSETDERASVQPLILIPGSHFSSDEPYGLRVRAQRVEVTNKATASLTGLIVEPQPGHFRLDRGPDFHEIPLDPNRKDLRPFKGAQVTITGTPLLIGNGARGRIEGLTVDSISTAKSDQPRAVTVERQFRNQIAIASRTLQANPFEALARNGLVSGGVTIRDWLLHLPSSALAQLPEVPSQDAPADIWKVFLEDLSLLTMRERCHADIALLQHRDVFFAPQFNTQHVNAVGLYALVNSMLWKGDFIECTNLTGAAINSLMSRSRELQDAETRGLSTDLSHGWSLASIGADARQNNASHRLVDAQWLDPRKLYSVAMTDYVANGDTGYPSVQSGEPPPYVPISKLRLQALSGCVTVRLLAAAHDPDAAEMEHAQSACSPSTNTFDDLPDRPKPPAAPRPGFRTWLTGWRQPDPLARLGSKLERNAQEHPYWSIDLFRAATAYSLYMHDGTEGQVATKFPGITVVDLSAPQSASLTFDYFARAQRESRTWQFYVQSELNYGHRMQRGKPTGTTGLADTAYQVNQSANFWYQEAGYARRLWPAHKGPAGWKALAPVGLRTQLEPQIVQIIPPGGASTSSITPPRTTRNYFISFRPGLRYEYSFPRPPLPGRNFTSGGAQSPYSLTGSTGGGQQGGGAASGGQTLRAMLESFIEFGYEGGEIFHQPSAFRFSNGTCLTSNLSQCLASLPVSPPGTLQAVISDANHFQQGFYLNFRLDMPMPLYTGAELTLENRGDFFAKRSQDTQVDARYIDDMKTSLVLPVYGKVSLAPTFELFLFESKVTHMTYRSYSTFVSLNYSFDWHTGLKWSKVLGFANPVPALPALPTR